MNKHNFLKCSWTACLCLIPETNEVDETDGKLSRLIQKGSLISVEKALKRLKPPLNGLTVTVKRRHLLNTYPCLVDHRVTGSDPFINFYQECSLVIWAIDCFQWQLLSLFTRYGIDINRPQVCRRWTYRCSSNSKINVAPYRRFWTRGRYTYQSALDYFFASVYEFVGEQPSAYGLNGPSPLFFYFSHLPAILTKGVDVHRIDSVIIFNLLALSFDQYLCRYTNEHATVPDIPESEDAFVEMTTFKRLMEHGFSQFECMDYLYPCCNWFGILLCLICHPKIDTYRLGLLPWIIRQAALLLINLLLVKCTFPSVEDFRESLENLHLRKVYSKRYAEKRQLFTSRLDLFHSMCQKFNSQPLSLKILSRNIIRRQIGGIDFFNKTKRIGLPLHLVLFVQYIDQEHLMFCGIPKFLISLAQGEWIDYLNMVNNDSLSMESKQSLMTSWFK